MAASDPIAIPGFGVPGIMPTAGTSRRPNRRQAEGDGEDGNGRPASPETAPDAAAPASHPPKTGRLVDKAV
jgi:hypothetical protein